MTALTLSHPPAAASLRGQRHPVRRVVSLMPASPILRQTDADPHRALVEQLAGSGVVVHAMHPGWADTPGVRSSLPRFYELTRPLLRTPAQGADTIVWLGAAAEPGRSSGRFWHDRRPRPTHRLRCTRETRQERERLLAECVRFSAWHDASVPTASSSISEGES